MKRQAVVAHVLLYLLTSQTIVDAQQLSSTFTVLRRDSQLDDDVTCHDVVVASKFACAATCLHDARCRVMSACVRAEGKSSVTTVSDIFSVKFERVYVFLQRLLCAYVT